jgi:hypothetical protein
MAEFNYSNYVANMAQRKGPMHEEAEVNPASDVFLKQSQSTDNYVNESETIYEYGSDGNCYRIDDEGNRDIVNDSYCRRYSGQGVRESDLEESDLEESDLEETDVEEAIEDTDTEETDDEFGSTDSDKEPTKKDIKAAEKEFNLTIPKADNSVADSALEKAKQIIKIKIGKILAQPKGQRSKSTDLAVLKQFIQRPDIKKAFKSRGLDVMDFVKDVIA